MSRLRFQSRRGFSLVELIMVMAIMLAVAAIALPRFTTFVSNYQLRAGLTGVSGVLQQTRMLAVRKNTHINLLTYSASNRTFVYGDVDANSSWSNGEPVAELPAKISIQTSGFPGDATTIPNFAAEPQSVTPQFNSRGLPCVMISGICQNLDTSSATPQQVGFVIYVQNTGRFGVSNWGAVTVTPAGRIQTWIWNGGSYSQQ
jgi:prepilin-type N-terminal cleavage/methylation domain-containing protein